MEEDIIFVKNGKQPKIFEMKKKQKIWMDIHEKSDSTLDTVVVETKSLKYNEMHRVLEHPHY
jgi:hypothetical protein